LLSHRLSDGEPPPASSNSEIGIDMLTLFENWALAKSLFVALPFKSYLKQSAHSHFLKN
jgi:hypothetical protein